MENIGMNSALPKQTASGGASMDQKQITLGAATYEIHRVFLGSHPAAELIADRLMQNLPAAQSVDAPPAEAV